MNIALISQEYPPETARGGIGSQTYTKAKGLSALGHNVFVISRSVDLERHESKSGGIVLIRIPGMESHLPYMTDAVQWLTHSIVVAAEIEALHRQVQLDIIDFPEWAAEGYVYLLNRTDWNHVPVVIQLHGPLVMLAHTVGWPDIHSDFYHVGTQMEASCVQMADAVYSSSLCSTQWIRKFYHPQKEVIPTIHSGIDTKVFSPQSVPKNDRQTILFVGKLVRNKGVEELVEAACHLVKEFPGLRLRMIGRGDEFLIRHLEELATGSGVSDMLELPGFINKENLPEELSMAHIFAAPSYYEGGPGFVYLEAMGCGLPVVACSGSGLDEIIEEGVNGILVPPRDSKALELALRLLLTNTNLTEEMAMQARQYVLKEAESDTCLKKLEAFYHSVVQSKQIKTTVEID